MYKIGDKVETPLGVGVIKSLEETIFEDEKGNPIYDYSVKLNNHYDFYTENKLDKIIFLSYVIKPYKSAHDKLIELGYRFWDNSNGLQYNKNHIEILIDKEEKKYKVYWMVDFQAYDVDIELSRILTQYLEELE